MRNTDHKFTPGTEVFYLGSRHYKYVIDEVAKVHKTGRFTLASNPTGTTFNANHDGRTASGAGLGRHRLSVVLNDEAGRAAVERHNMEIDSRQRRENLINAMLNASVRQLTISKLERIVVIINESDASP